MIRRGDLMFRHGKFHHTMLVTDPKNFGDVAKIAPPSAEQKIEVIHAASIDTAVYREEIDISESEMGGEWFTFYRAVDARLNDAVNFASLWAHFRAPKRNAHTPGKVTKDIAKGKLTRYSYNQQARPGIDNSRYSGVQHVLRSQAVPAFEFDALYRAFKWASRQRAAFSEKRGTTCCAFVTACFQAAAVDDYAQGYDNIAKGLYLLKELRGDKLPPDRRFGEYVEVGNNEPKKKVALGALHQFANPGGFSPLFSVNDYCRFVTREIRGQEKTIEDLFPPALLVDAKFNYSGNFERMVALPDSGFVKVL